MDRERIDRCKSMNTKPQSPLAFEVWRQGISIRYYIEGLFIILLTILLQIRGVEVVTVLEINPDDIYQSSTLIQYFGVLK